MLIRRRKKRTSIDTPVRVALEQQFKQNSKPTSDEIQNISNMLQMEKEVSILTNRACYFMYMYMCIRNLSS